MSSLKAGFAEVKITPPLGIELGGFSAKRHAEAIHDDLIATACVIGDGETTIAICSLDALKIEGKMSAGVREQLVADGIRIERILLAATHTHSGPKFSSDEEPNREWLAALPDRLAEAIRAAREKVQPACISVLTTEVAGIGGNRRDPGRGPVDRSLAALEITEPGSDRLLGLLVNHACHATTLGAENREVTADWPGQLRRALRERHGDNLPVALLNGACGDVNPGGYSAEDSALGKIIPNRTFERCAEIGDTLAAALDTAPVSIEPKCDLPLAAMTQAIELPIVELPPVEELQQDVNRLKGLVGELEAEDGPEEALDRAKLDLMYAEGRLGRAKRYAEEGTQSVRAELQVIAIGDIALLAMPGEIFTEIGTALKSDSPFAHTLIVGYANDSVGYFPTPEEMRKGGYESLVSPFSAEAIERMMGAARELLRTAHRKTIGQESPTRPES